MIDELVNDYCILGDDGAVIFSSFDKLLDFIEKIRADEREACAVVCDVLAAQDKLSNYYAVAARAIRARGNT
jgi:hypothetical protein